MLGIVELHGAALPASEGVSANTAIKDFEWIVEYELRVGLFDPFRAIVQAPEQAAVARKDSREWPENRLFRFLVSRSPEIWLGTMIAGLDDCRKSVIPTHIELRKYIENNSAAIFEHMRELTRISSFETPLFIRGRPFEEATPLKIARDVQSFLDALMLLPKAER